MYSLAPESAARAALKEMLTKSWDSGKQRFCKPGEDALTRPSENSGEHRVTVSAIIVKDPIGR